jgi:hypothetical protein
LEQLTEAAAVALGAAGADDITAIVSTMAFGQRKVRRGFPEKIMREHGSVGSGAATRSSAQFQWER